MPEIEVVKSKDGTKVEQKRHWSDKEVKEIQKSQGYTWRSNRTRLRVIAVTEKFRDNYDSIFRKK